MTVGHIAQSAIVNTAAGSDFWKITRPSGSHASGEIGRRNWMIGSNGWWNAARQPEQEAERRADGEREQEALAHPHERVEGEPADALVHLAVLEERLEDVAARLLQVRTRRRQVGRHGLAQQRSTAASTAGEAEEREHEAASVATRS